MPADWLPGDVPAPDLSDFSAWQPKVVRDQLVPDENWDELTYLVVDELQEGIVGIVATPWPRVDERGRLRFAEEDEAVRLAVPVESLRAILAEERLPIVPVPTDDATDEELRTRRVSIGDVFAARVLRAALLDAARSAGGPRGGEGVDAESWLQRPVLDVTAEARELAKVQTSAAAVKGVVDQELLQVIADEFLEGEGPSTTDPGGTSSHGPDRGSPLSGEGIEIEEKTAEEKLLDAMVKEPESQKQPPPESGLEAGA